MAQEDYLLGVNDTELDRLRFQHSVWGPLSHDFLTRLGIKAGWKCLDAGSGPGFVTVDLREMVGPAGEVTALELSPFYLEQARKEAAQKGFTDIRFMQGKVEEVSLPPNEFDLVFSRWVMSFAPDPEMFLLPLIRSLKPGGIIAIQDYYYEGLSLWPIGGAFDKMADVVRAYYRAAGGDPYVTGKLPGLFRAQGLSLLEFSPHCLSGGPQSPIMEWGHRFFTTHTQAMVEKGAVSQREAYAMVGDWHEHRNNPDALFFSPIVVDVAGKRE
ncbi:class I SAM-dependent methyltransferase [bacterium]|nr:MAG: class I SAM-dependent methyltransferase [bacterium]